ncbi:hypothetical protein N7468_006981 [Penicillium chermesinum]|uniref:Uncharacterized protein n=1 Tax=Penicillium chermesinum TaxID=63820 RepID=A0A9W9TK39_9EURO|nr:uncharacterized protein N7468_006981 [Penicillium chermesinum]KAJ5225756.1 hypothetical protein N7468_006981 [Penicillium chermesinum]
MCSQGSNNRAVDGMSSRSAAPDEESARPMDSQYAQVPPDAEQQANFEQPPWLGFMGSFSHFEDLSATSLQSPLRHESPGIDPAGKGGTMKVGDWANRNDVAPGVKAPCSNGSTLYSFANSEGL